MVVNSKGFVRGKEVGNSEEFNFASCCRDTVSLESRKDVSAKRECIRWSDKLALLEAPCQAPRGLISCLLVRVDIADPTSGPGKIV